VPDYAALEGVLGYTFRDRALLVRALRHASWCHENDKKEEDNQRLEFIGDAVLGIVVGHKLMARYPQLHEGELSQTRAQVVSEAGLSDVAAKHGLGDWLLLGRGEEHGGGRSKPSILADQLEALLGAVYLDGGFDAAWAFVDRLLSQRIESVQLKGFFDFKTRFQEIAQARLKATPTYKVISESGPSHDPRFVVSLSVNGEEWARAIGRSKKEAEQFAAAEAHFRIEGGEPLTKPPKPPSGDS
jgi:ribonuclease-3